MPSGSRAYETLCCPASDLPSAPSLLPSARPPPLCRSHLPTGLCVCKGSPLYTLQPVSYLRCLLSLLKPFLCLTMTTHPSCPSEDCISTHRAPACWPPQEATAGGRVSGGAVPAKRRVTGSLTEVGRRLLGKLFRAGPGEEGSVRKGVVAVGQRRQREPVRCPRVQALGATLGAEARSQVRYWTS